MTVLGLMSGTSFDGLDLCVVTFEEVDSAYRYTINATLHYPYEEEFVQALKKAHLMNEAEIAALEKTFDSLTIEAIGRLLEASDLQIDLIASHGHTTMHQPEKGLTKQIGDGRRLSETFGIPAVYDFRSYDVALGGQGAPLVPIGDELLFHSFDVCINLGGISNLSYSYKNTRRAFDIGMFNTPINDLVQSIGYAYDKDGAIARSGRTILSLYNDLNALEFYALQGAKSLGKEWYHDQYAKKITAMKAPVEDLVRTVTAHNVHQITQALKTIFDTDSELEKLNVLITGGGTHNSFAMELLRTQTLDFATLLIPDHQLIDYKEALIFAFMGYLRVQNKINVYSSVTGASADSCAGTLIQPNEQRTFS